MWILWSLMYGAQHVHDGLEKPSIAVPVVLQTMTLYGKVMSTVLANCVGFFEVVCSLSRVGDFPDLVPALVKHAEALRSVTASTSRLLGCSENTKSRCIRILDTLKSLK